MSCNETGNDNEQIMLNNTQRIETNKNFIHRGSMITNDSNKDEIRRRLCIAKNDMISLTSI